MPTRLVPGGSLPSKAEVLWHIYSYGSMMGFKWEKLHCPWAGSTNMGFSGV